MKIVDAVRERYAGVARSGLSSEQAGIRAVAEAFGYTPEELCSIPAEANMGLSCGNPTATANLGEGETVVDLGSGGGLDVFLAAEKVGPTGRAIGVDMTPEMVGLAGRHSRAVWPRCARERRVPPLDDRRAAASGRLGRRRDQ